MRRGLSGGMGGFKNTAESICKFFDIPEEVFNEIWMKIVKASEKEKLKMTEQIQVLAFILITELISKMRRGPYECINTMLCLPWSGKVGIKNQDYYALLFSSGVPAIIDSVIKEYHDCIKENKSRYNQTSLFTFYEDILTEILKIIFPLEKNEMSLYKFLKNVWNRFYSWKAAIKEDFYPPSLKEIRDFLNKKIEEEVIKIYFNDTPLSKLKTECFKKIENLQKTKIVFENPETLLK